jgi:hypothetical protein
MVRALDPREVLVLTAIMTFMPATAVFEPKLRSEQSGGKE